VGCGGCRPGEGGGTRKKQTGPKHLLLEQAYISSEQVLHGKLQAEKNEMDELR